MEFLEKLQRVCGQIPPGTGVQPVLSSPSPLRLTVGNWSLTSQREGEVSIHNADGTKVSQSVNLPTIGGMRLWPMGGPLSQSGVVQRGIFPLLPLVSTVDPHLYGLHGTGTGPYV